VFKVFSQENSSQIFDMDILAFQVEKESSIDIRESKNSLMVSPAAFCPFIFIRSNNCIFVVAADNNNIVRFIGIIKSLTNINGLSFLTPEGIHIGMSYEVILAMLPNLKLVEIPGWAYSAKLPSGWNIGFTMVDRVPTLSDTIDMIYMDNN
jgi:hypothetical protein